MALMKYREVLALAKDKMRESLAPLRANEMRKKGELEICKIEAEIVGKEQAIQELASAYPIDFNALIDATDELDLIKRRKEQFGHFIHELFDDAV